MRVRVRNTTGKDIGVMLTTGKFVVEDGSMAEFTEDDIEIVLT